MASGLGAPQALEKHYLGIIRFDHACERIMKIAGPHNDLLGDTEMGLKDVTFKKVTILLAIGLLVSCISCGGSKGVEKDSLTIAAILPLSGDAASYGEIQKRGITMALNDLSNTSSAAVPKVIYYDSRLEPSQAVNALQQSIATSKPQVVFSISTGEVLALAPICNRKQVVLLSPLASGDDISNAGDYVFRISPSDNFQGQVIAEKIWGMGFRTAGVLFVNDAFGRGLADKFAKHYSILGGEMKISETCAPSDIDFRTQLSKIKSSGVDALFLIVHPGEAIPAVQQIRELGLRMQIFGADTFSNRDIYTTAADAAKGIIFTLPAKPDSPEFQRFANTYEKTYREPADINAAAAYDAVMLVAKAAALGAMTGQQVQRQFKQMKEYEGASGLIRWDDNGDVISKGYGLYVIKDTDYEPLK